MIWNGKDLSYLLSARDWTSSSRLQRISCDLLLTHWQGNETLIRFNNVANAFQQCCQWKIISEAEAVIATQVYEEKLNLKAISFISCIFKAFITKSRPKTKTASHGSHETKATTASFLRY